MSDLPPGWAEAPLKDVCLPVVKVDPRRSPDERFTYIDIGGINGLRIAETKSMLGSEAPSRARQLVRAGDTVLSTVRTYLRKTALVTADFDGAVASTGFCVLRPVGLEPRYLFHRVTADDFVALITPLQTGSSYPAVRDRDVLAQTVEVPPLNEQRRIVAAIEEHLSRLDAADASLAVATARARRFREAVLEAAFGNHAPTRAVGDLAALTDGPFGSNLKTSHYVPEGPRVIRLQNIGHGVFRDEKAHITAHHFDRLSKHSVVRGDVVVASLGDDAPRACLVPEWLGDAIVKADCIRARPGDAVEAPYLMWALNSRPVKVQAAIRIKGIGRPRLGLGGIRALEIPVPPLEEQRRIVAEVEERLSAIDGLRAAIERAQRRSAALRRAVLQRAFRGELVPQDPSDEPAEALLARIRAERAMSSAETGRRRKTVRR